MIGGSAVRATPAWSPAVGADGTAANGPAAVIAGQEAAGRILT